MNQKKNCPGSGLNVGAIVTIPIAMIAGTELTDARAATIAAWRRPLVARACGPLWDGVPAKSVSLPPASVTISDVLGQAGIADECIALPWVNLAVADYLVKLALAAISIAPYGAILTLMRPRLQRTA